MKKHLKYVAIGAVAIAILAATIGGAVAFADSPGGDDEVAAGPAQVFAGKVADALGLSQDEVANAFREARQEMAEGAMQQRVENALEEGIITQDEATEILDWWQDRPEALEKLGPPGPIRHQHRW